jgi:hypothetical protein
MVITAGNRCPGGCIETFPINMPRLIDMNMRINYSRHQHFVTNINQFMGKLEGMPLIISVMIPLEITTVESFTPSGNIVCLLCIAKMTLIKTKMKKIKV